MILIDKPYLSGFLKETILRNQFSVIRTADAGIMAAGTDLPFILEEEAVSRIKRSGLPPLYTSSENSIQWIENNLGFTGLPGKIRLFKDKAAFRDLLKPMYPDFFYRKVSLRELHMIDPSELPFPVIIKPSTGFFSLGVHRVSDIAEWEEVTGSLEKEIGRIADLYPREVVNTEDFIIEECIAGDEYAMDCYFNAKGKPVILNLLRHLFSSDGDVSDRVYFTSADLVAGRLADVTEFLTGMGEMAGLKNFPAHVELRVDGTGRIVPIEVNPMRFGGWCTTADLAWYAWNFNAYEYFLNGAEPDWEKLLSRKDRPLHSVVVLDNSTGIPGTSIGAFDFEKLARQFLKPLEIRPVDHRVWPLFGFVFVETPASGMEELYRILRSDLREYVTVEATS